jgi:hypothetical protein
MLITTEYFSRTARDLLDIQMACLDYTVHAMMDGGVSATERNVDAIKTLVATATVATRQWLVAGAAGGCSTPLPTVVPNAGTAARSSLE